MLVIDNSVLSAFTRLNLFEKLHVLVSTALVSQEILDEYSHSWKEKLPSWITALEISRKSLKQRPPRSLSPADLSTILLALEHQIPLASDDRDLRKYARVLGIRVTGSLALLKTMYQERIIATRDRYLRYLDLLGKDVFLSENLLEWAKD